MLARYLPSDDPSLDTDEHKELRQLGEMPYRSLAPREPPPTEDQVKQAVWSLNPRKSPGIDGVTGEALRGAWEKISQPFTRLLVRCWESGCFPSAWKKGLMVLIPKKGSGFRPLTLLSVLGKVLEKLIRDALDEHIEGVGGEHPRQFGFVKGRSVVDAHRCLQNWVTNSGYAYVVGVFIDISGAFDNAWWPAVLARLRELGVSGVLYDLIRSYFSERVTYMRGVGAEVCRVPQRGCPQGSVLGPSLWKLVMDGFLRLGEGLEGVELLAYADDGTILVGGNIRTEVEQRSSVVLRRLAEWAERNKLTLSWAKTSALVLKGVKRRERAGWSRGLATTRPPTIRMGDRVVSHSEHVEYLGVTMARGMTYGMHIGIASRRARDAIMVFRRQGSTRWGYSHSHRMILYKGLFLGIISYAAPVWAEYMLAHSTVKVKVLRAQRAALLAVTRCFKTVSTDALCVIAGVPPVDLVIWERAETYGLGT